MTVHAGDDVWKKNTYSYSLLLEVQTGTSIREINVEVSQETEN